ncbi:histidine--tRNA ligase [Patescibacteria group bacterium]|nr:histidine--tRNA ligase [Patescibacteria group bacterium]
MPKQKMNTRNSSAAKKPVERKSLKAVDRLMGMKDTLPAEFRYLSNVMDKAASLAELYSFNAIKTPVIESLDLFKQSMRNSSDKEIYGVNCDKGEKAVLRPELTQGILRAYIENNFVELPQPVRLYTIGPVFRHEKMQNGRFRESNQFNMEVIGEDKPMAETLLIAAAYNFFLDLEANFQIQINSLGKAECRKEYNTKLSAFYKERGRRAKLCNNCKKALLKTPMALLDCKEDACQQLLAEAPQIADCLSDESREHFAKVLEYLDELNIPYNFNPYLVRGLSYYNDTVFEFWPINDEGAMQSKLALAGGGRYDNLVESLGGKPTPSVGIAIGLERTVAKIKDKLELPNLKEEVVFLAQLGEQAKIKSLILFEELRRMGFNVRQSFSTDSLKNQMEEASRLNAKVSLILGKKEVMDETILLRDMESGVQETVAFKKVKDKIAKKVNRKEGVIYG